MKAEERHELHENLLAKWLGEKLITSQSYLKLLAWVLLLSAVAWLGYRSLHARSEAKQALGWTGILAAQEPADLEKVAKQFPDTLAGAWALQRAADTHLQRGGIELLRDFKKASEHFELARDSYKKVIDATQDDILSARAHFGAAQAYESLRELPKANEFFQTICDKWPDSSLAKLAALRIRQNNDPATVDFYDWYFQQKPPMSAPSPEGGAGAAGGTQIDPNSPLDLSLPSQPDIELPSALDGSADPAGASPDAPAPTGGANTPSP
ncbi:MAG: hypothetical protein O2931_17595 [Planctomycetota bacterium]|nr:hypothetical protein [Planctomycetota bacterium]MDA1180596.1 hypothetical protein [Planctomycetota bacterium]